MYNNRRNNFRGPKRANRSQFNNRPRSGGNGGRFSKISKNDFSMYINKCNVEERETTKMSSIEFKDLPIETGILNNISNRGYKNLTPIQEKSIPAILNGSDFVGIANTGTGKTAAFLIPLLDKVYKDKSQRVLILAPTRELAAQINDELYKLTRELRIYSVLCVGGTKITNQLNNLRRPYNFIVGTPGRINDLTERRAINLGTFQTVGIDEVDRMFDMGFNKAITWILDKTPTTRQTLFFSATISDKVQRMIDLYLKNPIKESVTSGVTSANIEQDIIRIPADKKRIDILHELLINTEINKALIFGKTKKGVEEIQVALHARGVVSESIHGDKRQSERNRSLRKFKENEVKILIATDVVARGLDITDISHVINYDLPATYEDYVHRIGRTGRGTAKGKALTFI